MADTAQAAPDLVAATPLFLVPDVVKAAEYYRDSLGFRILDYYGDPPCFVFVTRGWVQIMLKLAASAEQVQPNGVHDAWDAYLWVNGLDALHEELKTRGANILSVSPETVYHTKEVDVLDCNGYRLCFAEDTSKPA